jgi:hypothetical protein
MSGNKITVKKLNNLFFLHNSIKKYFFVQNFNKSRNNYEQKSKTFFIAKYFTDAYYKLSGQSHPE